MAVTGCSADELGLEFTRGELALYDALFDQADADGDGVVGGKEAVPFLRKSNLEKKHLAKVWALADVGKKGYLTRANFYVAMRCVALMQTTGNASSEALQRQQQTGEPIRAPTFESEAPSKGAFSLRVDSEHARGDKEAVQPSFDAVAPAPQPVDVNKCELPAHMNLQEFTATPGVAPSPWSVTSEDRTKYESLFSVADVNKDEFVDDAEARAWFTKSGLAGELLSKIWFLSDVDEDGKLNHTEFAVAMHLVYHAMQGKTLPDSLPSELLCNCKQTQQPQQPQQTDTISAFGGGTVFGTGTDKEGADAFAVFPEQPSVFSSAPAHEEGLVFQEEFTEHKDDKKEKGHAPRYMLPGASFDQRVNFEDELRSQLAARLKRTTSKEKSDESSP